MKQSTILAKIKDKDLDGLTYKKTRNTFENYKASCTFHPATLNGYSYGWYLLTAKIKGLVVLNSYAYSNQTAKHVSKMRNLFSILGIRYVEIHAPRGLQDLNAALEHHVYQLAKAMVEFKYARIKFKGAVIAHEKALNVLAKLGKRHTKAMLTKALEVAEQERIKRNEKARTKALKRKLENYLENDVAFRDYDITDARWFGDANYHLSRKVAVHQIVERQSMERDVENALHNFQRDGFGSIVFYVKGA